MFTTRTEVEQKNYESKTDADCIKINAEISIKNLNKIKS